MSATYYARRAVIREEKNKLSNITKQFPFLFSEVGLSCHFENLVGIPMSTLRESLAKQCGHVFSFISGQLPAVREIVDNIR